MWTFQAPTEVNKVLSYDLVLIFLLVSRSAKNITGNDRKSKHFRICFRIFRVDVVLYIIKHNMYSTPTHTFNQATS